MYLYSPLFLLIKIYETVFLNKNAQKSKLVEEIINPLNLSKIEIYSIYSSGS